MAFYGDLVNALAHTAAIPAYLWLARSSPHELGAWLVNFGFIAVAILQWLSYARESRQLSLVSCGIMAFTTASINLCQWPHAGENLLLEQFIWTLLILSGNLSMPFLYKAYEGVFQLFAYVMIAVMHPLPEVAQGNALTTLWTVLLIYLSCHYYMDKKPGKQDLFGAHLAMVILVASFILEIANQGSHMVAVPGSAKTAVIQVLKAGFFASIGLTAAGGFRTQTQKVDQVTREILLANERLKVVELALQATFTAIAITDDKFGIEWSNSAFDSMSKKNHKENNKSTATGDTTSKMKTLFGSLQLDVSNQKQFLKCQTQEGPQVIPMELSQNGSSFRTVVSPFESIEASPVDDLGTSTKTHRRYLIVFNDITEQRARERAEKVAEQQAIQKQALSDSMETLTHELRTPLQGIMGMTSLLAENEKLTAEETADMLGVVMASSRLLLTLINNILDHRKCEAQMMQSFQLTPLPLESAMNEVLTFCKPLAQITDVDLTLIQEGEGKDAIIMSNTTRFGQIMINLVSNAIKYTKKGTEVQLSTKLMPINEVENEISNAVASTKRCSETLSCDKSAEMVAVISVSDCGDGLPVSASTELFGKFGQLKNNVSASIIGNNQRNNTLGQSSGTGLGLNLCAGFVEKMNGRIWATNTCKGARFSFYCALSKHSIDESNSSASQTRLKQNGESNKADVKSIGKMSDTRVLVVDDTPINLKVLKRMLDGIGVANTKTVSCGEEAYEVLRSERYDLVITDLQMPGGMSGTELSDAIRESFSKSADPLTQPIVVGLTAAESMESLYGECAASGMSHVLHKPMTALQIRKFFNDILPGLKPNDCSFGNLKGFCTLKKLVGDEEHEMGSS